MLSSCRLTSGFAVVMSDVDLAALVVTDFVAGVVTFLVSVVVGTACVVVSCVAAACVVVSCVATACVVVSCVAATCVVVSCIAVACVVISSIAAACMVVSFVAAVSVVSATAACLVVSFVATAGMLNSFVIVARVVIAVAVDVISDLPKIGLRCFPFFFAGCTALCCLYSFRAIAGIFVKTIDTKRTGC